MPSFTTVDTHLLSRSFQSLQPTRQVREMYLLQQLLERPDTTQRELAEEVSISPAAVNQILSALSENGYVEILGESNRSTTYRVTEIGEERLRELAEVTSQEVVQFYGGLKRFFIRKLRTRFGEGPATVVLFGAAETGELVLAATEETSVEVVGVVDSDPAKQGRRIGAHTVVAPGEISAELCDAVVITSFGHGDEIAERCRELGLDRRGIEIVRL